MKNFFLLLIAIQLCSITSAQTTATNALSFPSTNNSFLGKPTSSASIGLDYYTGTAQVNIPVCTIASKELSVPVALDYVDGKGVRVQEYASQVGLGWQLNAGGRISRVVRGFPDENANGYLGTGQWGQIITANSAPPNNYTTFFQTISQANALTLTGLNQPNGEPQADGEPDIFSVKTPFFDLQFVFDKSGVPVFSNSTGYKVIPSNFVNTSSYQNSSFEVIDPAGNQYYFGNTANSTESSQDSIFGQLPPPFITSWYLTKIVSYNAKDVVNFTYQAATGNDVTYNYSWTETQDYVASPTGKTTTFLSTGKTTIFNPKYISTIVTSLGELDFSYIYSRRDDANVPYLANIVLKAYNPQTSSNSTTLQTFNFSYNYFNSSSNDPNLLRLQLSGVTISGNTAATSAPLTLASFGYNTTATLPNRTTTVFDYWGYATTIPGTIPPDIFNINRTPNVTMAQAGILTSVTGLAGDTWQLTYELNAYRSSSASTNVGGLRVNKIAHTLPTGESIYKTYQYADASGYSYGQIYSNNYSTLSVTTMTGSQPFVVYFSSSPYTVSDVNGTFVGYTYVKEVEQNGGYTMYYFTNFSDYSDPIQSGGSSSSFLLTPNTSLFYKRGLLKDESIYNANGNIVAETQNTYAPLSSPVTNSAYGLRVAILPISPLAGGVWNTYGYYSTPIENFRLTKTVQITYDQITPANNTKTTLNYTYVTASTVPANNNRLIQTISTTDSKNNTHTKTMNYAGDNSIPLVTTAEQTAITDMIAANKISPIIHVTDNKNGVIHEEHNSYTAFQTGLATNVYLTSISNYATASRTLIRQQTLNYDLDASNIISSHELNGLSTALIYDYNGSYPVAKVQNASSTSTYTAQQTTGSATISPAAMPGSVSFTVGYTGTITINLNFASTHGTNDVTYVSGTLSGPVSASPVFCYGCSGGAYGTSYTITNAPPGNYTLSASVSSNNYPSNMPYVSCSYPKITSTKTYTNEFFYEGFEQYAYTTGTAHSGNMYYTGNYTVPFIPPNGRSYTIQYWNLAAGAWSFNEKPYTTNMVLTGPVDDVRVFPSDGLITTTTYNPLVGKTSDIDPSGHALYYQYDGLGRQSVILDNELNIQKAFDYKYQQSVVPPVEYSVVLGNQTTYPAGITTVTIDGVAYSIPAPGTNTTLAFGVTAGSHTIKLSSGPSSYYTINGTIYTAQTLTYNVTGNVTINYINTPAYTVTLNNQSTYPANIVSAQIDGVAYNFPGPGLSTVLSTTLTPGNHTILLAYGPSSCYTINGVNYTAAQTNPAITYSVTGNLTINYLASCPVTVTSAACNLTSDATNTTACSCHGCQYTATVYYSGSSAGVGTQLYTDAALTQKVTGKTWFMEYSTNLSWPISSTGVITGSSAICQ